MLIFYCLYMCLAVENIPWLSPLFKYTCKHSPLILKCKADYPTLFYSFSHECNLTYKVNSLTASMFALYVLLAVSLWEYLGSGLYLFVRTISWWCQSSFQSHIQKIIFIGVQPFLGDLYWVITCPLYSVLESALNPWRLCYCI